MPAIKLSSRCSPESGLVDVCHRAGALGSATVEIATRLPFKKLRREFGFGSSLICTSLLSSSSSPENNHFDFSVTNRVLAGEAATSISKGGTLHSIFAADWLSTLHSKHERTPDKLQRVIWVEINLLQAMRLSSAQVPGSDVPAGTAVYGRAWGTKRVFPTYNRQSL